jgi:hypothetical protein
VWGDVAEIEDDGAESTGVEQVVDGFKGVAGVRCAADPDELGERDSGCSGGHRVERITGVDVSTNL